MNYTGPKVKISRKIGINITPKSGKYAQGKPYPPGQFGPQKRRGSKQSDYGKQLLEKQRLRYQYNLSEKQMKNYYEKASRMTGNTEDFILQLLETRLDSVLFRSGMARSLYQAKQLISHGHILVNGKKIDIPSYQVKVNDIITISQKFHNYDFLQDNIRNSQAPQYIEVSKADFSAKLISIPTPSEIPIQCNTALVIEYYSR
ncbi:MAG TPA: 30S ribosomal protein S4 [Candidatus Kapabacteria bacterium]|jgi:small subunit ribosomal protein S4|nr:30S ribosomal protein S4 [Candidatus Kapabacteria bacterium]HOV92759.1 30S ribosomal protein S4 [Candidatus Kapabacteria bacterium]